MSESAIPDAQLVTFAVLSFPALYNLFKHGGRGFLGWFYVVVFCAIRVVGCAMQINDQKKGTLSVATDVVSSLGLSPLLLACAGILHEARKARGVHRLNGCCEWLLVIQYHLLVAVGIIIVASRASALASENRKPTDQILLDVGFAIIDACWVFLSLWTCVSARPHSKRPNSLESYGHGTRLLYAVLVSLPFTGIRVIYATVCYAGNSATAINSLPLKVIFDMVPEMVMVTVFLIMGLMTRDLGVLRKMETDEKRRPRR